MKNNVELINALKLVVQYYYHYDGEVSYATLCDDLNNLIDEQQDKHESENKDEE